MPSPKETTVESRIKGAARQLSQLLPKFVAGIAIIEAEDGYLVFERRQQSADSYIERYYWAPSQSLALQLCYRGPQNRRKD